MHAEDYLTPVLAGIASLRSYAREWYVDKGLSWPSSPPVQKIDLNHHMVPSFYAKGKSERPVRGWGAWHRTG